MKFEQYRQEVKRTLPSLGSVTMDSIHMVLGMCSELYEVKQGIEKEDKKNVAEELTDIAWYASNYCNIRDINVLGLFKLDRPSNNFDSAWRLLIMSISELQDYDKKELAYKKTENKEIAETRASLITLVFHCLNNLYSCFEIDCEQSMQNNINKLRKRFPNSFNEHEANNRNLNAERKELEK